MGNRGPGWRRLTLGAVAVSVATALVVGPAGADAPGPGDPEAPDSAVATATAPGETESPAETGSPEETDAPDETDLGTEARTAPIIMIPGLLGSELVCGFVRETDMWPGTAVARRITWSSGFEGIGLINTIHNLRLTSVTTSSSDPPQGCGSQSYGDGTAADHEPSPKRPTWCVPEARLRQDGPFASCPIPGAQDAYNSFGYELQQAATEAGRGQEVVFWPWDWRKDTASQVEEFQREVERLLRRTGTRPTVVAHSFGNTFFREWVRQVEADGAQGGDYVGRFLSVAGPWWGTAEAWTHPAFGQLQPGFSSSVLSSLMGPDVVKESFRSFPGVYEIMPDRAFDDYVSSASSGDEHWLAIPGPEDTSDSEWVDFAGIPDVVDDQFTTCPQQEQFPCLAKRLYERAVLADPGTGFDESGIEWTAVVGTGVDTPEQICSGCVRWPDGSEDGDLVTEDAAGNEVTPHRIRNSTGDANVPLFSAIQGSDWTDPPGDDVPFYFTCGVTHMGLMSNDDVLAQTIPFVVDGTAMTYSGAFKDEPSDVGSC